MLNEVINLNDIYYNLSSSYLKALSHPTRIKILQILGDKELCVCTVLEELELEQSNVSQHLRVLKDQSILQSRREGSNIMYKVKNKDVFKIFNIVRTILLKELEETQSKLSEGDQRYV